MRRDVLASGQRRLPSDVHLARNLQPVMDGAGSDRSGQDLDDGDGEMERIRQSVLREAEENFKMEIRKLRGEGGTDSRSYHSVSSGADQGAPHADQGDPAGLWSSTTPPEGRSCGLGFDGNSSSRWSCSEWNSGSRSSKGWFLSGLGSTGNSLWWCSWWIWGAIEES